MQLPHGRILSSAQYIAVEDLDKFRSYLYISDIALNVRCKVARMPPRGPSASAAMALVEVRTPLSQRRKRRSFGRPADDDDATPVSPSLVGSPAQRRRSPSSQQYNVPAAAARDAAPVSPDLMRYYDPNDDAWWDDVARDESEDEEEDFDECAGDEEEKEEEGGDDDEAATDQLEEGWGARWFGRCGVPQELRLQIDGGGESASSAPSSLIMSDEECEDAEGVDQFMSGSPRGEDRHLWLDLPCKFPPRGPPRFELLSKLGEVSELHASMRPACKLKLHHAGAACACSMQAVTFSMQRRLIAYRMAARHSLPQTSLSVSPGRLRHRVPGPRSGDRARREHACMPRWLLFRMHTRCHACMHCMRLLSGQ